MTQTGAEPEHLRQRRCQEHGETSRQMFPEAAIEAITNGVHAGTWTSPPFQQLFDRYIPSWREDNYSLRSALGLPPEEVWQLT